MARLMVDLERDATCHRIELLDPRALSYRQTNTKAGRYTITKTYVADPDRPTLLIQTRFKADSGGTGCTCSTIPRAPGRRHRHDGWRCAGCQRRQRRHPGLLAGFQRDFQRLQWLGERWGSLRVTTEASVRQSDECRQSGGQHRQGRRSAAIELRVALGFAADGKRLSPQPTPRFRSRSTK